MKMKKLLGLSTIAVLALSLTACGSEDEEDSGSSGGSSYSGGDSTSSYSGGGSGSSYSGGYGSSSTSDDEYHGVGRAESRNACHDRVKEQLKSPGSADFEGLTEGSWTATYRGVNFSGWVDSENSFGAKIRSIYDCEVYYEGGALMASYPEIIQR